MTTASIWWIRRDLRLADNQALTAALNSADAVIPLFVLDPKLLHSPNVGEKRKAFLFAGLRQLAARLKDMGGQLIVRQGNPVAVLQQIMAQTSATRIFAEADFSPYARRRDDRVAEHLPLERVGGVTVFPPNAVLKGDGTPYIVYTPYSKNWKQYPPPRPDDLLPAPQTISTPAGLSGQVIPAEPVLPTSVPFSAGETEAQHRLQKFVTTSSIYQYGNRRNRMDQAGTAQLSPYLRFGMISARQVAVAANQAIDAAPDEAAAKSATTWLNELIWREFYISILFHFPQVRTKNFRQKFDTMVWENDETQFLAWCQGRTGYPVVDAAMRQLVQSGWMHNRARMIVASFLVKHLLIDWRWGERFFMQHLLDGDPAANNGGWQWTAGGGTDAAPYFRIFNPILQSEKFDPDGTYIRRWLPELANVPAQHIHGPWEMLSTQQKKFGCRIGTDYPNPIVEHSWARQRALAAYEHVRGTA